MFDFISKAASAVSDLAGAALNAASTLAPLASLAFPQLAIAQAVGGLITQGVGQAVNQAAQQLCKEAGMPKFLQDVIGNIVKDVIGKLTQQQPQCDPACHDAAKQQFGGGIDDLIKNLTKSLVDGAKAIMEQGGDEKCEGGKGGKKGAANWLVAMAKAMGDSAGAHLKKMVELSNQIADLTSQGGNKEQQAENAQKASGLQAEFQAESQLFNMLQSSFSTAIKSIGEGLSQMARKG